MAVGYTDTNPNQMRLSYGKPQHGGATIAPMPRVEDRPPQSPGFSPGGWQGNYQQPVTPLGGMRYRPGPPSYQHIYPQPDFRRQHPRDHGNWLPYPQPQPQPQQHPWHQIFGGQQQAGGMVDYASQHGWKNPIQWQTQPQHIAHFGGGNRPSHLWAPPMTTTGTLSNITEDMRKPLESFLAYMHLQKNRGNIENFNWGGAVPWERQRSPWDMFGGGFGGGGNPFVGRNPFGGPLGGGGWQTPGGNPFGGATTVKQLNPQIQQMLNDPRVQWRHHQPTHRPQEMIIADDGGGWGRSRTYGGPARVPPWMMMR